MYCKTGFCRASIIIICLMLIFGFSQRAFSQDYPLQIRIGDIIACPGQQNVEIPIYLENYTDSIAAFSLWLQLNRPDIMEFQTGFKTVEYNVYWIYTEWDSQNPEIPVDSVIASPCWVCLEWDGDECISSSIELGYYACTVFLWECLDSVFVPWTEGVDVLHTEQVEDNFCGFDTVGTLIQGWEMVEARSFGEIGYNILISALTEAPVFPPDQITPGIGYPQDGQLPLIKVIADIYPIDESITDRDVEINIEHDMIDYFCLSNERGKSLGVTSAEVENTEYYMCLAWADPPNDDICLYWHRVMEAECPPEGCDSIRVDTIMQTFVDADRCCDPVTGVCVKHVSESECPDEFGGTGVWHDGSISITNGSVHVEYCLCGDSNNDGQYNILDIVHLINFLYKGGPAPVPEARGDNNRDGKVDILDVVCLLNTIYKFPSCCYDDWLP